MTYFTQGDKVVASLSVQGMTQGATYEVLDVHELQTPFGNFARYDLQAAPGGPVLNVGNAHMLCWKASAE